ncbi:hypothetical protein Tsubulata_006032, partial [Turnera subulata]
MLDGILGRGFASKCKSLIKTTKNRIDVNRRKKNATLKFLKRDMADLLSNGLDINAYGRAEGLLDELRRIWCYDFIEQCCDFVLKHLSVMQKIRHCPEDCREAVSSLMSAAARYSELPELRDLRDTFYERYGNSVELFVNQELMQDIASEFSLKWDPRACEQMISKTPASAQDQPKTYGSSQNYWSSSSKETVENQPKTYGSPQINVHKYMSTTGKESAQKRDEHDLSAKERLRHDLGGYRFVNGKESNVPTKNELSHQSRHGVLSNGRKPESNVATKNELNHQSRNGILSHGHKPVIIKEESILKMDILIERTHEVNLEKHESWKTDTPSKTVRLGISSQRKKAESGNGGSEIDGRGNAWNTLTHRKPETLGQVDVSSHHAGLAGNNYGGQSKTAESRRDVQEQEVHVQKPYHNNALPPPYTKPNSKPKDNRQSGSDANLVPKASLLDHRTIAVNGSEVVQQEAYHVDHSRKTVGTARENSNGHEGHNYYQHDGVVNPIPKPRSMRRRHSKSHSSHGDATNLEDTGAVRRSSRSRRRNDPKKGLQILVDDDHYEDEEERIIDKLLLHYSKKPSADEPGRVRRKSRSRHAHHHGSEADVSTPHLRRDGPDETPEVFPPRSISLPREQTTSSEATKTFTRAASFNPDRSSPARHVHPKLPDYDDLAARFAALKGRLIEEGDLASGILYNDCNLSYSFRQYREERERERELRKQKMKGTSKVIMGATLVMVVTLAIVLALVLVLLVELYCTLLLRRRQLRAFSTTTTTTPTPTATATTTTSSPGNNTPSSQRPSEQSPSPPPPLSSYYAQGVLQAPRNLLFPAMSCKEHKVAKVRDDQDDFHQPHNVLEVFTQESHTSPQHIGVINTSSPLSTSFPNSPQQIREIHVQISSSNTCCNNEKATGVGDKEHLVYISNPIYDNNASRVNTPYETPDSSPSRLEQGGSSGEEEGEEEVINQPHSLPGTPPLTPMKKLPAQACSVSLRDATSLGTSGSDSVSNNGISSSSSGSPCTSPSW